MMHIGGKRNIIKNYIILVPQGSYGQGLNFTFLKNFFSIAHMYMKPINIRYYRDMEALYHYVNFISPGLRILAQGQVGGIGHIVLTNIMFKIALSPNTRTSYHRTMRMFQDWSPGSVTLPISSVVLNNFIAF